MPARRGALRLVVFLGAAAAAVYCGRQFIRRVRFEPPQVVATVKVTSGPLERTIRLTGSTAARRGIMLRAPYLRGSRSRGGSRDFQLELTEMATPGSRIKRGDIVAVFDSENMRNRLDDVKANRQDLEYHLKRLFADQAAEIEAHEQKIRVARANIDTARLDLQTAPVRSAIQAKAFGLAFEEAQATYKALTDQKTYLEARQAADRRIVELQLEAAGLEEQRDQANLERLTVRAPIDGLAVSQEIYRGGDFGEVRTGDQLRAGQPYLRIVDPSSMVLEATANQADATRLRIGQPVHIGFDAYANLTMPGTLTAIGSIARTNGGRPSYVAEIPVTISIAGTAPQLIPSLSASADLVLGAVRHSPILPREAVFDDAESDGPFAIVQTASGWERRPLELGLENNLSVAVRSGVRPGESVALEVPAGWVDHSLVTGRSAGKAPSGIGRG